MKHDLATMRPDADRSRDVALERDGRVPERTLCRPSDDGGSAHVRPRPAHVAVAPASEPPPREARRWTSLACWYVAFGLAIFVLGIYDQILPNPLHLGWEAMPTYLHMLFLHTSALPVADDVLQDRIIAFAIHLSLAALVGLIVREYTCIVAESREQQD